MQRCDGADLGVHLCFYTMQAFSAHNKTTGSIRGGFDFCFSFLFFAFALLCVRYVFHCVIEDLEQVILFERLEYEAFRADLFGGIHGVIVCE